MSKIATVLPTLFATAILLLVVGAIQMVLGYDAHLVQSLAFFFFLVAELLGIMAFVIFDQREWPVIVSVTLASLFLVAMIVKPFLA
jgi:hypothetical protein